MLLVPDAAVTSTGNDVDAIDNHKKLHYKQADVIQVNYSQGVKKIQ